jgi:hypothetical protein
MGSSGLNSSGSGVGSVTGYSEFRHQQSGSTQHEEFLGQLGLTTYPDAGYPDRLGP